ncbi:hypothetical protein Pmar_PMAR021843 [Perkinsus marinus ATCC 50983]|uniref:Uncharacterized protein n=1 Tax=Perkinsus marinus (strain ATCC 50983 / TXsc) TaxID=423536 RepID=C5LG81_PERM5|nr:hypothetical protein Pmar_PMAR021843 [Perkinsus marinus ATCC 50983]EER04336.1 hypothetical protein Pmar_PMAR021843 [Perkinsus marinus ATCC 50983]|eukprot:XP_002772520.1 hypothetical protein Pmar_PMAR021843 [Perkinsus marinus ATCC 50983]
MSTLAQRIDAATVPVEELRIKAKVDDELWQGLVATLTKDNGGIETVADLGFCHPWDIQEALNEVESALDRSRLAVLFDLCRNECGLPCSLVTTEIEKGGGTKDGPKASEGESRVKSSQYIDGLADGSFSLITQQAYEQYLTTLRAKLNLAKLGKFGEVSDESIPSREQLSGLKSLVEAGNIPFVDLYMFTGNQRERLRSIRQAALRVDEDGKIRRATLSRIPTDSEWATNFRIYSMGLIMLGVAQHADMLKYAEAISRLFKVYGTTYWPQVYAADVHLRSVRLVRYKKSNNTWGGAYAASVGDSAFWMERVDRVVFQLQRASKETSTTTPSRASGKRTRPSRSEQVCYDYQGGRCSGEPCPNGRRHICIKCREVHPLPRGNRDCRKMPAASKVTLVTSKDQKLREGATGSDRGAQGQPLRLVSMCGDWDTEVPRWFIEGAPVGLAGEIGKVESCHEDSEQLQNNYPSTYEHFDEVMKVLETEEECGFCKMCTSFDEVNNLNDYCFVKEHIELPRVFDWIDDIVELSKFAHENREVVEFSLTVGKNGSIIEWSLVVDASPTGLGGFLKKGDEIISWFSDSPTDYDCCKFNAIIAIRMWSSRIPASAKIICQSDSVAALSAASRLRSRSPNLNCIAQELALHCAVTGKWYQIEFVHLPGDDNQIADSLSRLSEDSGLLPFGGGRAGVSGHNGRKKRNAERRRRRDLQRKVHKKVQRVVASALPWPRLIAMLSVKEPLTNDELAADGLPTKMPIPDSWLPPVPRPGDIGTLWPPSGVTTDDMVDDDISGALRFAVPDLTDEVPRVILPSIDLFCVSQ